MCGAERMIDLVAVMDGFRMDGFRR